MKYQLVCLMNDATYTFKELSSHNACLNLLQELKSDCDNVIFAYKIRIVD